MDERLRNLERQYAASGSEEILEQYRQEAARTQLIPSKEDIELMRRCGFVKGRTSFPRKRPADKGPRPVYGQAVTLAWGFWLHAMKQMVENSFEWRRNLLYDEMHYQGIGAHANMTEFYDREHTLDGEYETLIQHLDDIKPLLEPPTMIADMEYPVGAAESIATYVNQYLRQDEMDMPDLYLHYNDVTGSALMGFMNTQGESMADHFKIYITIRELRRLSDEDQITLEADIEWNNGLLGKLPIFSYLPDCLWEHPPGTWCQWGYGDCKQSYGGFIDYSAIDWNENTRFLKTCD